MYKDGEAPLNPIYHACCGGLMYDEDGGYLCKNFYGHTFNGSDDDFVSGHDQDKFKYW